MTIRTDPEWVDELTTRSMIDAIRNAPPERAADLIARHRASLAAHVEQVEYHSRLVAIRTQVLNAVAAIAEAEESQ